MHLSMAYHWKQDGAEASFHNQYFCAYMWMSLAWTDAAAKLLRRNLCCPLTSVRRHHRWPIVSTIVVQLLAPLLARQRCKTGRRKKGKW